MSDPTMPRSLEGMSPKEVAKRLQELFKRVPLPPRVPFSDPDLIVRWVDGKATIPEGLKSEFARWLQANAARRDLIEDRARVMRTLLWAYVRLARDADGEDSPEIQAIGHFLLTEWKVGSNFPLGDSPTEWAARSKLALDVAHKDR